MNKEEILIQFEKGEELTLCDDDLITLLRRLLFHGGKVIAEVKTDDVDINCFKVRINKL